jgi:Glycosyl hydrolase family 20, catalytic domain
MSGTEKSGLAVRGLHLGVGGRDGIGRLAQFIREVLPREGVNLLVAEIDYSYAFSSYPQVGGRGALTHEDVLSLLAACRAAGVELVPQINCLGHQSWGGRSGGLLRAFPEFDETPWIPQDAGQDVIYCRSYCPNHPKVHEVLFALIDELAEVCGAGKFHVGMDEVFLIAEAKCPRCAGQDPGKLFAQEVTRLHDHLAEKGLGMWMWGDRLINAEQFGTGKWEGSANGTWPAVDAVAKDIAVCDWHYERAFHTPEFFIGKGLGVVASPWRRKEVSLEELDIMRQAAAKSPKALGVLQTTWCGSDPFIQAYNGEQPAGEQRSRNAAGAAESFKALFAALRGE